MRNHRKTEIRVGVTVIISLIIFLFVFGWAKNLTVASKRIELKVRFQSVAGLEIGDPVTINGVRKGYVNDMTIEGNSVLTLLNLEGDSNLKSDAAFSIMMLDLMGGKKIDINPGNSADAIDINKIYSGTFVGDVASAMAVLGSVQADLVDVIKEVKISLKSLNVTLTDQQFNSDLKKSLSNLVVLTNNLNTLINNNSSGISNLLKQTNELTGNVNKFITSNQDSIKQTLSSIQDVLKSSKELLQRVNKFFEETDNQQNNLGKVLKDPVLVDDIKSAITQVKELIKILVDQLKAKGIEVNAHIF